MRGLLVLSLLAGCADRGEPPAEESLPLGLPRTAEGETLAGAAVVDLTPTITETFDDANGNFLFDGCFDDPTGERCGEGFEDADGDGRFDAVFIGGFDPLRPARTVHDSVTARALVLEDGGEVVAIVAVDFVGLGNTRIDAASRILEEEDGLDADHLLVASTHNHQGPDTMGLWGNPFGCIPAAGPDCQPGFDPDFQDRVTRAIVQAVRDAAAAAERVDLKVGRVRMRDVSPYYNGETWGGHNPTAKMHGLVHDIRDPVVVSDQLLVLQGTGDAGTVFTWTSWSGHPEVRGGENDAISADWPGEARRMLEETYGGIALHTPECLGGMQSALGGDIPAVDEELQPLWQACTQDDVDGGAFRCATVGDPRRFEDDLPVPQWADHDSWTFVRSHGFAIAEAARQALDDGATLPGAPLRMMSELGWVPIRNVAYDILGPAGVFDLALTEGTRDTELCPEAPQTRLGCVPIRVFRLQIGDVGFASAPGELLPELAWGLPTDDPAWVTESADPTARGDGSRYFPQHDHACDTVTFDQCRNASRVGDCDCLRLHAWPYTLGGPDDHPVLDDLDTEYRAAISMTSTYLSYIVPAPDVNTSVSLLSENDGDHYEDTVTAAYDFSTVYLRTWRRLQERW